MKVIDCVALEMRMASIMAQQEASGFRFDLQAAERVRGEFEQEMTELQDKIAKLRKFGGQQHCPALATTSVTPNMTASLAAVCQAAFPGSSGAPFARGIAFC